MDTIEPSTDESFLLRKIITNLENERILSAVYNAAAYAVYINDFESGKHFKSVLEDAVLCRKISLIDAIKNNPETAVEYYDKDMNNDPYEYDSETEKEMTKIKLHLIEFVADAIRNQGSDIDALVDTL